MWISIQLGSTIYFSYYDQKKIKYFLTNDDECVSLLSLFYPEQDHQDVSIYDPIFTTEDHLLFEELNMKITANKACVFFILLLGAKGRNLTLMIFFFLF
jgi:hypothetical protein